MVARVRPEVDEPTFVTSCRMVPQNCLHSGGAGPSRISKQRVLLQLHHERRHQRRRRPLQNKTRTEPAKNATTSLGGQVRMVAKTRSQKRRPHVPRTDQMNNMMCVLVAGSVDGSTSGGRAPSTHSSVCVARSETGCSQCSSLGMFNSSRQHGINNNGRHHRSCAPASDVFAHPVPHRCVEKHST